ncbi:MAG: DUF2286 domain-containing protein [Zestosphaera sp.]
MKVKTVVAKIVEGDVENLEVREATGVGDVVKDVVVELLKTWDPERHDLIITRHEASELSELKERIPVYVLSPSSEWRGEELVEKEIIAVFPYVSDELTNEILRTLAEYSKFKE